MRRRQSNYMMIFFFFFFLHFARGSVHLRSFRHSRQLSKSGEGEQLSFTSCARVVDAPKITKNKTSEKTLEKTYDFFFIILEIMKYIF